MSDPSDTICALASAHGRSALAVVRVSGAGSLQIWEKIFKVKKAARGMPPRSVTLGDIVDPDLGTVMDQAIAVCYRAPKSYTGEDMTEYTIHGSPVLVAALLHCICSLGARLAEPGEFTMRAFLNGKMDLTQAEAVRDIVDSTTLFQAQVAAMQRSGEISGKIRPLKESLIDIVVQLESAVEFVDEDLPVDTRAIVLEKLRTAIKDIRKMIDTHRAGRVIREGFRMAVVGRPNVGKSSLFNALLEQDRSIVMDMPGTTRDLVAEHTSIQGIPVRLMDTAGLSARPDSAEGLGIEKTYRAISDADAILIVVDRSRVPGEEDLRIRSELENLPCMVVLNKNDLESRWSLENIEMFAGEWPRIEVSAKYGDGIERLRSLIFKEIFGSGAVERDDVLITNLRHRSCLEALEGELLLAVRSFEEGLSEEFPLMHLHKSLKHIGEITGETSVEDLLTEIFSRFCIGK
ncbi:MAG: tRNA uridine-5-carboxymethylaminomethyl(34) synthesis GTPase MnmE [Acidobacteria bacterium]|nr:tRNA uridine-5-carboxymethylaminomethyl(34) synthesis GTPase MnmE [Acidobacteriota bacterium]